MDDRAAGSYWTTSLLASTAIAIALVAAMPAQAQEAEDAAPADTGEIIVTATRRDASIQKVPISMQALGEAQLAQHQVASFDDYAKLLPSVSFDSFGPGQAQLYFRGVNSGGDGLDVGSLPTVGLYLDDIPVTTIGSAVDLHVYDIARVEALAGPQGTLFGASSLSGTLRIITNKPDPSKFEGGYDVQLNKFGKGKAGGSAEGFVNIPLSEKAAIRLVGYYEREGGYIDNTYKERTFTLDDSDDSTNVTVNNRDRVGKNQNDVESYGGRAALKVDLDDDWTVTPQIVYQHQKADGTFLYDPRVGDLQVHDFSPTRNLDRWYQAALTIEGKIGNWDLVYSGGYFERKIDNRADYSYYTVAYDTYSRDAGAEPGSYYYYTNFPDGNGGFLNPTQEQILDYKYTKQTHEVRISSPAENRFRLTAGAFMQRQTGKLDSDYSVPGVGNVPVDGLPNLYPVPGFGDALFVKRLDRVDRDYAAFAEANFDIVPDVTLTAGIRGFIVDNNIYGFSGLARNTVDPAECAPTQNSRYPCINVDKKLHETGETHKVSLSWKIDQQKMIYGTYSTGYRPGGSNRRAGIPPYLSDTLSNFELGWKTTWLDGHLRFNGAVFYERWKDMQFALPGENGVTYILNAGRSEVKGVEADLMWRADGLQLSFAGAYIDAALDTDFCDDSGCTPKGTRLPTQPKFKGNVTARYNFQLGSAGSFVQATMAHQSGTRTALLDDDVADLGYTKGFTTFDFSVGSSFGSFSVEAFIQNAFDKRGQLSRGTACAITACNQNYRVYPTKPQLFGVKMGQRF
jgi:iron complex outermembrane recepter protein